MTIRTLRMEEIPAAMRLVWEVFVEFEAPDYTDEGIAEFRGYLNNPAQIERLAICGAFDEGGLG